MNFLKRCRDTIQDVTALSWIAFVASWLALFAFLQVADEVRESEPLPFDHEVLNWLHAQASPPLDFAFLLATKSGNAVVLAPIALLTCAFLCWKCRHRQAAFLLVCVGGAAAFNVGLKLFYVRNRPNSWPALVTETDYSFPSGHAMGAAAFAAALVVLSWNTKYRWGALCLGVAYVVLVGVSRLYLGVHFPSDVLAGWCASLVWTAITFALIRPLKVKPDFSQTIASTPSRRRLRKS